MAKFIYARPTSIEETVQLLEAAQYRNKIIAGGTDLLINLRNNEVNNDSLRLVDISRIPDLHRVECQDNLVILGAALTFSEIILNPFLQKSFPILIQACSKVGGPQIRNMATLGGNIANAAACADSLPVLACLNAQVHLCSSRGERSLPIEEFILGKNKTACKPGELLASISLPLLPQTAKGAFVKLGRRNAQTTSRLTVAVIGNTAEDDRVDRIRIVPGSVTDTIRFYPEAEAILLGISPTPDLIQLCAQKVTENMVQSNGKRWSTDYKAPVLAKLTERALTQVFL